MPYNDTNSPTLKALRMAKQQRMPYRRGAGAVSDDVELLCYAIDALKERIERLEHEQRRGDAE